MPALHWSEGRVWGREEERQRRREGDGEAKREGKKGGARNNGEVQYQK